MKVALYARVSMDENSDSKQYQEPENQLEPLRDMAKAMKWEVVAEYTDKMSGANPARPQFRQLMNDAMLRKFECILVWRLDRFSREGVIPTLAYLQKLKTRGVYLKSLTESWLDTSQEGISEVVIAILSWIASEERKKISERTKAGIARRRALGNWKGGRPRTSLSDLQLKEARQRFDAGETPIRIARDFRTSKRILLEVIGETAKAKRGVASTLGDKPIETKPPFNSNLKGGE